MAEKAETEERIKNSFQKVKEDISSLKSASESQKEDIKDIKTRLNDILTSFSKIKEDINYSKKISNGNDRVINNHQQSSTIINNHQQSPTVETLKSTLNQISQTLTFAFQDLSDREFSVFAAIFELEKRLPEVTYTDLANTLKISEPTVRSTVNRLISKKLPLQKVRFFNKKVSLSIPKDFHDANLLAKIIKLHQNPHNQKTFSDMAI